ncbi:Cytochrome P450, E-class, group I [Penicillium italicum]|uniref:Cytochrome P450, E-class, group I n=1 Tax=Penicillium italicum TaxID=40296 RepID=A0A0A2LH97_PENIT|nr:Cytochrome P450, E-class, group I [Penicillium italicum]
MTLISFMSKFAVNTHLTDKILTNPHNRVYSPGSLYLKDPHFFQTSGGISEALPALVDPDYHKRRRKMINSLFSAKSIDQLAPIVLGVIKRALKKAAESHEKKKPLDIQRLYTGVTIDTIMRVLCDEQLYLIEAEEEEPPFMATLRTFSANFFLMKHIPILTMLAANMPTRLSEWLVPGDAQFRRKVTEWIEKREDKHRKGIKTAEDGRKTILDLLLQPEDGSTPLRKASVVDETYSFCFAGTHTTSLTISMATYYLLKNPEKLEQLREELRGVKENSQGMLEYRDICRLPYLTAVIKESLRLSSPVPGVIPRVVPAGGITWAGHFLPEGTSVSIAIRTIHDNPHIFPDPASFIPERWLQNDSLDHWLVVFGKGSRSCIGLTVAWMELYLCLGNFFAQLDMSLYNTDESSVQWNDCGNAMIHRHVKVTVDSVR